MKTIFRRSDVHYRNRIRPGFTAIRNGIEIIDTICKVESDEHPSGKPWVLNYSDGRTVTFDHFEDAKTDVIRNQI